MDSGIQKQKLGPRQQAWVDALRSGKYEQGRGVLRSQSNKFCCLGVACDLTTGVGHWMSPEHVEATYKFNWALVDLPVDVMVYYGFHGATGLLAKKIVLHDYPFASLIDMNDSGKMSFAQIADMVEADPANFFVEPR